MGVFPLLARAPVYENFQNDALDAVRRAIRQRGGSKNLLRRDQFGFNIGGPVYIPRVYNGGRNTFFFFSYEGVRERICANLSNDRSDDPGTYGRVLIRR